MQQYNYHHGYHTNPHPSPPSSQEVQTSLDGLPRRLESSLTLQSPSTSPPTQYTPVYPSRQQSQHYQSLNAHVHASQQLDLPKTHYGLTEEEYEELEDRRRMKQQILRDKLEQAEYNKRSPDPNMSVKMTTSTGFALGTFDMTESLAIVDDILDYFGDDNLENEEFDHAERFNETQLIEAEKTHLQRESLVRHLYDSEEDYLRSLQDIQTCYQRPMLLSLQNIDTKKSGLLSSSGPKPVASNQEIETLFGNLDQLIEFHEEIRAQLDNRSKIWGPTQIMSDLLINVIPKFKLYSKYFTNFHAALTVLDRISRTVQYKKFMEQQCVVDNPPGTASLHLMLAFPLKRLSTYRDLIAAICKATQSNHPDYYNLMRALDMTNLVSNELRPERVMAEDQLTLWDVQSSMVGLPEPIMIPARRLLLRADLHKVDSTLALEPRTYYLMNDVLLYARFDPKKNVYTFKGMFDLARSQVNNPEDNLTLPQLPNCIQIANSGRKQMMRCRSREERNFWMETMRQAVDIVNRSLEDTNGVVSAANGETLPMRRYANSIASDSSSSLGHTTMASGSAMGGSKSYTDSRSINSKSSSDGNSKSSKPRKPNPQTDFYGCSFGTNHEKDNTEDNYKPRTLGHSMASNSSASSVSTGATGTTTTIQNAGTTNHQSLGAMLAAIPESKLTPKQVKEKAALAAAVEARRQARLKKEAKSGGATATATARGENSRNVNFDFSSSFIPAKDRIAKQHNDH
ncbi:hypothetical protein BGW38_005160 [Lunasporangiospora selenospora]|uniref:DH domain-containing protein n=1 Tax=Lunasporangiospora selenospora TaxID=979761 RepID=A0A9P6KBN1_9FUNG|nr:hypothetical protein BGW38_005160 [Lunasporangiospora selenospora]